MHQKRQIWQEIEMAVQEACSGQSDMQEVEIREIIDQVILEYSQQEYIPLKKKLQISEQVYDAIRGYDCLEELLRQKDITEIMLNGYDSIFIERQGVLESWEGGFSSKERYMDVIQQIVASCNRIVNESTPIVDARLEDGSRVNVVLPPVALDGAVMTIRRFPDVTYTMKDLVRKEMLSDEVADILKMLVKSKYNILISGGTGSGKTTFLNALTNFIPVTERLITIEDSAELQIQQIPNLVRMEVRNANIEGRNAIGMKDLIRSSLRMRPDRIIVGEVRGEEAVDMLQAMNTGHSGSLTTGHANSARDMLYRLETMVLMGMDIPLLAIRQQIASAIEIIVHIGRVPGGKRRVLELAEITGMEQGEIKLHTLYRYQEGTKIQESDSEIPEQKLRQETVCWKRIEGIQHDEKMETAGYMEAYRQIQETGIWDSTDRDGG